ncbi:MAG: HAMP domain-containing sensor histidine kinase [bacterium]
MNAEGNTAGAAGCRIDETWDGLCAASLLAELVSDRVLVVDERLQILRANPALLSAFGNVTQESVCGCSLGEVADCRHAAGGGACGGAAACAECGWFQAVRTCQREGAGAQECRILKRNGAALDFAVTALRSGAGPFCVCGLKDLFAPKRLRVLERAFFHDVTNLAAGIRGLCELVDVPDSGPGQEVRLLIHDCAEKLVDEVERLRVLRVAENGDLRLCRRAVAPGSILQAVAARFQEDASARHVEVVVEKEAAPAVFETDKELLTLVFGELARNAIEASTRGDRVTLTCAAENGRVVFSVHNQAVLDERVQAHVFERSFTTRGPGRGVGAYRARLIAERYLNATVGFVTREPEGTTFYMRFPLNESK